MCWIPSNRSVGAAHQRPHSWPASGWAWDLQTVAGKGDCSGGFERQTLTMKPKKNGRPPEGRILGPAAATRGGELCGRAAAAGGYTGGWGMGIADGRHRTTPAASGGLEGCAPPLRLLRVGAVSCTSALAKG